MAMVGVDSRSLQEDSQPKLFWSEGRQPLGAVLYSSNEPGELSQWFCHDDSTINIGICIIIIIIASYHIVWHGLPQLKKWRTRLSYSRWHPDCPIPSRCCIIITRGDIIMWYVTIIENWTEMCLHSALGAYAENYVYIRALRCLVSTQLALKWRWRRSPVDLRCRVWYRGTFFWSIDWDSLVFRAVIDR